MDDPRLIAARRAALAVLRPPPRRPLSTWVEEHVWLPAAAAAEPGRMRLWPWQRAIADSIGAEGVERVTVLKSARVGYTQLLVAALGHYAVNDPCPVLVVLPADADARHLMATLIEPTFRESPTLRGALMQNSTGRDTMLARHFTGGTLHLTSARSPRNLRARTARVLFLDEVDGYEIDVRGEGDPVELAIRRTMTFGQRRKIVMGSTPVDAETSRIARAWEASDQRIFEVPCPSCGDFHEIAWKDIRWPEGRPEAAEWGCPGCGTLVPESAKPAMAHAGRWRALRPEVVGHHGYRLSSLISPLPAASWGKLAGEFLEARRSAETLKTFVNTVLGEAWRGEGEDIDPRDLARLRRPMSLAAIPPEVLILTAGADVQGDRIELSTVGWTRDNRCMVLAHEVVWGSPLDDATWIEVDDLLKRRLRHPHGGELTVDAAVLDSGYATDQVLAFTAPRTARRIVAGKGVGGFSRPTLAWGAQRRTKVAQVGVDAVKQNLADRMARGEMVTISDQLGDDYLEQLASERLVTRFAKGVPVRQWTKIPGRRNEALDCLVYATAARQLVALNLDSRADALALAAPPPAAPTVHRSKWLSGG